MQLSALLKHFKINKDQFSCEIKALSLDSRNIEKGSLFLAYPGYATDGRDYIDAAIKAGAVAVVYENRDGFNYENKTIPVIGINNLQEKVSTIAAQFYHSPSEKLCVVGITGTNGKTSCSHYIAQALAKSGQKTAVMGTIGNGILGDIKPSQLTSENAIALQKTFAEYVNAKVDTVAIEASSHGLAQHRMDGIAFDIAVFTNLTRDHLDYHKTFENYGAAKARLFDSSQLQAAVINIDDPFGMELIKRFQKRYPIYGYSQAEQIPDLQVPIIRAQHIHLDLKGIHATIKSPWGDGVLHSNLIGRFNVANLLAIVGALGALKVPFNDILRLVAEFELISGRVQVLGGGNKPYVVIDYAHTPDALEKVLQTLKELQGSGKIWCVFGCGGDRDKGKRPLMGRIADELADEVIVTNDNPRHEIPQNIAADIMEKMNNPKRIVIELDRKRAIAHAIQCAQPNDIVLIAGKGHERYQQIGDEKIPFSDAMTAQMLLEEK